MFYESPGTTVVPKGIAERGREFLSIVWKNVISFFLHLNSGMFCIQYQFRENFLKNFNILWQFDTLRRQTLYRLRLIRKVDLWGWENIHTCFYGDQREVNSNLFPFFIFISLPCYSDFDWRKSCNLQYTSLWFEYYKVRVGLVKGPSRSRKRSE